MKKLLIALLCTALQFSPAYAHAADKKASGNKVAVEKLNAEKETDLAAQAYQAGDYPVAIEHFNKVVKLAPNDAMAWHFLGQSLAKNGDVEEAKKAYEQVLQLQPNTQIGDRTKALLDKLPIKDCRDCPEMIAIPAGSFDMGGHNVFDSPIHRVNIEKPFAIGRTEVTQGQWKAIMGNNPSYFSTCGDNCPVEQVSWNDTQEFIKKLNAKTGKQYRLPSNAEWEYACRAGGQYKYCGSDDPDSVAWYGARWTQIGKESDDGDCSHFNETTHPVAKKQANAWGLFDMSGNISEWVEDLKHKNYKGAPTDGSAWKVLVNGANGTYLYRGGSWNTCDFRDKRSRLFSSTVGDSADGGCTANDIGFRLVRTLP